MFMIYYFIVPIARTSDELDVSGFKIRICDMKSDKKALWILKEIGLFLNPSHKNSRMFSQLKMNKIAVCRPHFVGCFH